MDFTLAKTQFQRALTWLDITPSKMALPYLQSAIELYFDCGISHQQLIDLWNHWSGTLGDSALTLEPLELRGWYELGRLIGADVNLLTRLEQALEQQNEPNTDAFAALPSQKVVIFTLREHAAQRAIEKLKPRNPSHNYVLCTDSALTTEAKAHARSADIVVIVMLKSCYFHGIHRI